jgi:cytochrome c556
MRTANWLICATFAALLYGWSAPVAAQDIPATEVIKNRIHNFKEIGTAFKGISDELKSKQPYVPSIQESAGQIESLGSEILMWFPPGTGPAAEPDRSFIDTILGWFSSSDAARDKGRTHAKPAVWTERTRFEQAQRKFHAEAQKMNEVAQSGDRGAIAAQFKVLGATCKNCHDTFREKIDDDD